MPTTIQIDMVAKQRLDLLKAKYKATSYNDVILKMTEANGPREMFGSMKGTGTWTKADRMRFKDE